AVSPTPSWPARSTMSIESRERPTMKHVLQLKVRKSGDLIGHIRCNANGFYQYYRGPLNLLPSASISLLSPFPTEAMMEGRRLRGCPRATGWASRPSRSDRGPPAGCPKDRESTAPGP